MFTIECGVLHKIWRYSPVVSNMCLYGLWSSPNLVTHQSNIKGMIKKHNWRTWNGTPCRTFERTILFGFKNLPWNLLIHLQSFVKVKCLPFISPKWGVLTSLEHSSTLNIWECIVVSLDHQNVSFLELDSNCV